MAAVEQFVPSQFDLVLMDLPMPEMDGFVATESIRRIEGGSEHTITLALTVDVLRETRKACAESGMDGFLSKPVKLAHLDVEYRSA